MVNSIKRWYFITKMNLDGHYYALRHKSLRDSFLVNKISLSMSSLIPEQSHSLVELCKSFDTLVIDAYQTFSLITILKHQQSVNRTVDKPVLTELDRLFRALFNSKQSLFTEASAATISNDISDWNYDFRIINNSPHSFQICFNFKDNIIEMQLKSDYHYV